MPNSASAQYALKVAVKAKIDALIAGNQLPGLETAPVLVRKVPGFQDFGPAKTHQFPGVVIANSQPEADVPITNEGRDRGYSIIVAIALQESTADYTQLMTSGDDTRLAWRDVLIDNLAPKGIVTANPTLYFFKSEFTGGQVVDWQQFATDKRWISGLNFRFWLRRHNP